MPSSPGDGAGRHRTGENQQDGYHAQQGAWTRWEVALERKLTWTDIWQAEPQCIKFMVRAVYDMLPSPAKLHVWGKSEPPTCLLCPKKGKLEHIRSSCPTALGEGHYRWQHDQLLRPVAEVISRAVTKNKQVCTKSKSSFVRAGKKPPAPRPAKPSILLLKASDWEVQADLGRQL